jgi:acetylornithine deacetylase/succinyl-diaminopimelate desuccinylase-like protein
VTEPAVISTDQLICDLDQLIGMAGSTGQTDELRMVAARIAAMMRNRGLKVDVRPTPGAPIVIGWRGGRQPFTLLLYHHYDTPSPGPWRAWLHDPFQLAERDGMVYGRGVADGKGPLAAHLNAIAALIDAEGELPCGVVVVAEGDYLTGSPYLGPLLADRRALFRADACLASGGDRDASGLPLCYSGVKGLVQIMLRSQEAQTALPAGMAASVPNPLWRLIWTLNQIKTDQEEILIGGFYDTIEGPTTEENRILRTVLADEAGRRSAWQVDQFLFGLTGAPLVRSEVTLPTCNINMLHTEPVSDPPVIPRSAVARLDFQLVPRQRPQAVVDALQAHLAAKGLTDILVERLPGGYPPAQSPIDDPFVRMVSDVGRYIHGQPLTILPRGPFTMPLFYFAEAFGIPVASISVARPSSAIFGANECIPLPDLVRHGQHLIEVLYACATTTVST